MLLSHGGEVGGFCEAQLCPTERHAMDGLVAGAQHQGWVVLQLSCKALESNALDGFGFSMRGGFARQRLGKGLSVDAVSTLQ
ncbi:hypothetical protein [Paraglaciecola sp. T6c]|uniref:hypothetical protein n=1 Tax=Pseudoalteromonas atlantica (strain T6c / ATCC BAA-1087) TaxID=3042615 RepID=UPI0012EDA3C3|nr:hypothetical protein [Paraglaciecola sp. T6c]